MPHLVLHETNIDETLKKNLQKEKPPNFAISGTDSAASSDGEEDHFISHLHDLPQSPTSPKSHEEPFTGLEMLVELFDFQANSAHPEAVEWIPSARWMNYEENVEGVDHHWGRKHTSFLPLDPLTQLRQCIARGSALLDVNVNTYSELCNIVATNLTNVYQLDKIRTEAILAAFNKRKRKPMEPESAVGFLARRVSMYALQKTKSQSKFDHPAPPPTPSKVDKRPSATFFHGSQTTVHTKDNAEGPKIVRTSSVKTATRGILRRASSFDLERAIQKAKVTGSIESTQVLAGIIKEMKQSRCIIVRLEEAKTFADLSTPSDIPIRFVVMIIGPESDVIDYHQMGRSVGTLFSNHIFQLQLYEARTRQDFIHALDDFIGQSVVVPPGDLDRKPPTQTVDELKKALKLRCQRVAPLNEPKNTHSFDEQAKGIKLQRQPTKRSSSVDDNPLKRTGKLFGGVVNDFKRRFPFYVSDFKDGLNLSCLGSMLFMFFAAIAPAITFGGLLGEKTHGWMGTTEVLVAQSVCGIIWALFSAQPLLIMGATGPVLVFEKSLFDFCRSQGIEFMVFRVWIGFWILLLSILTVMFEGSFLIGYVTGFTEDIFSTLIALIFIVESLKFMYKNFHCHYLRDLVSYCTPITFNTTLEGFASNNTNTSSTNSTDIGLLLNKYSSPSNVSDLMEESSVEYIFEKRCDQPDTALLSAILVITTFVLAFCLRQIRTSFYLGRTLRRIVGDFAVPIALFITVSVDVLFFSDTYLQHLDMPDYFGPTLPEKRGWFISPLGLRASFPVWAIFAALIPAVLVYILIFVEVQITELLLNRKDRGLTKGCGFHWDLLLVGFVTVFCSLLGLPWMCTAIMQSLAHCGSLTVWKKRVAGKPMQVDKVIEQRITTIGVSLLTGVCAFLGFILKEIPIAVLFGVFMFLGVMNLAGVDLINRFALLFLPQKYFPDKDYCQKVNMWHMHLYTFIQVLLLIMMWTFKSISVTSLAFPFILLMICLIRIFVMPKIFTHVELEALDGHEEDKTTFGDETERDPYTGIHIPM